MSSLEKYRAQHGLSLRAAAEAWGISFGYLCQIEKGERTPSVGVARRLAEHTGLSLDHILSSVAPEVSCPLASHGDAAAPDQGGDAA